MREYAKLAPKFWTGETGKRIKKAGPEGVVVAVYLMSSPHSNMIGIFHQPVMYMAYETGLSIEGASKGLRICMDAGFCRFDEASDMVWLPEMAQYQIAKALSPGDKRCKGIRKDYAALPDCPFLGAFFDRYAQAFHLPTRRNGTGEPVPVSHAPSKPLRSQEQEQEQEQHPPAPGGAAPPAAAGVAAAKKRRPAESPEEVLRPEDVDAQVWGDWLKLRKAKKAPVTPTVLAGAASEAAKAGMTLGEFLAVWCRRGTQGLEAAWLKADERGNGRNGRPPDRIDRQLETAGLMVGSAYGLPAAAYPAKQPMEFTDVAARAIAA